MDALNAVKETALGPAVFTPVEYDHPAFSGEFSSFTVASVGDGVFLRRDAYAWGATPWTTCSKQCETGTQTRGAAAEISRGDTLMGRGTDKLEIV